MLYEVITTYTFIADITGALSAAYMTADIFLITEIRIEVEVQAVTLLGITAPDPIHVAPGTAEAAITFPDEITVTTSAGSRTLGIDQVVWTGVNYNPNLGGTYTFTAPVALVLEAAGIDAGSVSTVISVQVAVSATSVSGLGALAVAKVFPNPASGVLNLVLDGTLQGEKLIELYTLQGALIQSWLVDQNEVSLDLSASPSGNYLLRVNSEGKTRNNFV